MHLLANQLRNIVEGGNTRLMPIAHERDARSAFPSVVVPPPVWTAW